ncbi:hypothetical protein BC332_28312 [Capsicum chinense]|nr:hypothetical protein BC332_28312 [Capsicum chinense]
MKKKILVNTYGLAHLLLPYLIKSDRPMTSENIALNTLKSKLKGIVGHSLDFIRTIHASDDTGAYEKVVNAIFNEDTFNTKGHNTNLESLKVDGRDTSCILFTDLQTESRDHVVEIATEVFRRHCAKHLEIIPMRMLGECPQPNSRERNAVKLLTHGGDMVELCHELRLPFVKWIVATRVPHQLIGPYQNLKNCIP